jgi:hypothetical protein
MEICQHTTRSSQHNQFKEKKIASKYDEKNLSYPKN